MGRLFGTDGARGIANTELTCELAMNIGRAAAMVLTEETHHRPYIIIGKDTRISSDMLENALTAGICSVGADAVPLGVIPTPAVAYLVRKHRADAGIMISASHNPMEYNGIKIFNCEGYKLPDSLEDKIEAIVLDSVKNYSLREGGEVGRIKYSASSKDDYIKYLCGTIEGDLSGIKIAVDCANGSSSATAPELFRALNADCDIINSNPDGVNINHGCGSTHIEKLSGYVVAEHCDVGVAFDGDADRCIAVDENGNVIDGDKLIAIFTENLRKEGRLRNNTMAVTMMSNLGLFKYGEKYGVNVCKTKVGDRYVLEEMLKNDFVIGGENSGHIIFLDYATTGDGELSALQFLRILKNSGLKASELASIMETYPQVMVNVTVGRDGKERLENDEVIGAAKKRAEKELGGDGRIIIRPSGTEPLIRVMIEGREQCAIEKIAKGLEDVIRERLG